MHKRHRSSRCHDCDGPGDTLDCNVGHRQTVNLSIYRLKVELDKFQHLGSNWTIGQVNRQFVPLSQITQGDLSAVFERFGATAGDNDLCSFTKHLVE